MKQIQIDKFINSSNDNCYEIVNNIKNNNPINKKNIIKIVKEHKDFLTPFLLNYISNNNENNLILCDTIEVLYSDFRENMMIYMNIYGMTPYGFKKSLKKWKINHFHYFLE